MPLLGCRAFAYNALMSNRAQELLREALTLSPDERADVAAELLASLDEPTDNPADVEAAWAAEIERRARRVLSGERLKTSTPSTETRARRVWSQRRHTNQEKPPDEGACSRTRLRDDQHSSPPDATI